MGAAAGLRSLATVIVHPEGGHLAGDMKGVTRDLAQRGYLAVAVDYRRLLDGEFRRNTFAWRETSDPVAALDVVRAGPRVDRGRIVALGFSQGGIYSIPSPRRRWDRQTDDHEGSHEERGRPPKRTASLLNRPTVSGTA
jgi:dienelactone hydrolase